MHEQMNQWTGEQQRIWKEPEDVGAVFLPQEKDCDRQKQAEAHSPGNVKGPSFPLGLI